MTAAPRRSEGLVPGFASSGATGTAGEATAGDAAGADAAGADAAVTDLDPGLAGRQDRPVAGIDNGYVAGYRVRFDEAGADGRIRTGSLLRYAQDIAWRHSEELGFDRAWYTQQGRWWVVRSAGLEVLAPIPMGQILRLSTAVIGHRRIWARRQVAFRLPGGTLVAEAMVDWVLLDERGRILRIPSDFGTAFPNPELGGEILRVPLPSPPADVATLDLRVRPQDLDPMGHVNNAVYVDWIEEAVAAQDPDALSSVPRHVTIEYAASAEPGNVLLARSWRDGDAWWVQLERNEDGTTLVRARLA
ncbi:MAG: acyl-ACP thioesterase domain-containing protein [Chloroflexota bacterium]